MQQLAVGGGHLGECHSIIHGGDGNVATIEEGSPRCVGVDASTGIEAAEGGLAGGCGADGAGPKACACDS